MPGAGRGQAGDRSRDIASARGRDWGQKGDSFWPAIGISRDVLQGAQIVNMMVTHVGDMEMSKGQGLGKQWRAGMGKEEKDGG